MILITILVTIASAKMSFSRLKSMKNYLKSTMSQEWLNGLATLYIGKKLLDTIMVEPSLMILYLEMLENIFKLISIIYLR